MQTLQVQTRQDPAAVLLPDDPGKDAKYRLGKFAEWLAQQEQSWQTPDLGGYRDELLAQDYAPSTVKAHLATIRARYRRLLSDNSMRDMLYDHAVVVLEAMGERTDVTARKTWVDEAEKRLENDISPVHSKVRVTHHQDEDREGHLRLTPSQAMQLVSMPGTDTLMGLRDTAIIALILVTGIREAELVGLDVKDLRIDFGGELALFVSNGKGDKTRKIPYGEMTGALAYVDAWLDAADIEDGPVFRGFYRGAESVRPTRISKRAIGLVLDRYPVMIDGELRTVEPHDLRRSYARLQHDGGMSIVAIKDNLGHEDINTTIGYIGTLDADARRARAVITFDLSGLYRQERLA